MRLKILSIVALVISLLASINYVQAHDWHGTSIASGYAVTTDRHGELVQIGESVTAIAGTTDSTITKVTFRWLLPDETEASWSPVEITMVDHIDFGAGPNGEDVYVFIDGPHTPNVVDDWGVQAFFYDTDGNLRGKDSGIVKIRATSFFAVPEVPFGTIAILIAMLGALGLLAIKRKARPPISIKAST